MNRRRRRAGRSEHAPSVRRDGGGCGAAWSDRAETVSTGETETVSESGQRLCRDGSPDGLSGCHRRDAGRDAEEFSVVAAGGGAVRDTMFR